MAELSPSSSERRCAWCSSELPATARADGRFCGRKCRQAAFRLRRRRTTDAAAARPLRFAYADPPYPRLARRYYRDRPEYRGEVNHAELIASLEASGYAGWALSTGAYALRELLPLCPPCARVCAWVKPIGVSSKTYGLHNTWEPLIVVVGRRRRPGVRDWLRAHPARKGGDLPGRKPLAFCAWLFDCLGMLPGDDLVDLFPGTGIVSRAWAELSSRSSATHPSRRSSSDTSAASTSDVSRSCRGDGSQPGSGDTSLAAADDGSPAGAGDGSPEYFADASAPAPDDAR